MRVAASPDSDSDHFHAGFRLKGGRFPSILPSQKPSTPKRRSSCGALFSRLRVQAANTLLGLSGPGKPPRCGSPVPLIEGGVEARGDTGAGKAILSLSKRRRHSRARVDCIAASDRSAFVRLACRRRDSPTLRASANPKRSALAARSPSAGSLSLSPSPYAPHHGVAQVCFDFGRGVLRRDGSYQRGREISGVTGEYGSPAGARSPDDVCIVGVR